MFQRDVTRLSSVKRYKGWRSLFFRGWWKSILYYPNFIDPLRDVQSIFQAQLLTSLSSRNKLSELGNIIKMTFFLVDFRWLIRLLFFTKPRVVGENDFYFWGEALTGPKDFISKRSLYKRSLYRSFLLLEKPKKIRDHRVLVGICGSPF